MDNVTHSLIGVLAADCLKVKSEKERITLRWAGVISSNLPDADFLYAGITGGKLGYLVHHRGHTHTLGLVIPLAFLVLGIVMGWRRDTTSRAKIFWLSVVGIALHIAMDTLNNYGTHPFWPFSSRWIYGDTLFIVEPYLWIVLLPLLFFHPSRWMKRTAAAIFVALFGLVLFIPLTTAAIKGALALFGFGWFFLCHKVREKRLPLTCGLGLLGVISVFALCGLEANRIILEAVPSAIEISKTPLPANPVCWSLWVREDSNTQYLIHRGEVSLFPHLVRVQDCPRRRSDESVAGYYQDRLPNTDHFRWSGLYNRSRADLRQFIDDHCEMNALARFARLPFWERTPHGIIIGDLRFDWDHNLSFAKIPIGEAACPGFLPDWRTPLWDWTRGF
ncbi:MAG: metal-dependent hydrolase [Deltaproteobacteria bacterium]|nr:metal-dependent hydrolase [Deltaproteobacteria bacterium]MBI3295358.1 metal-dependent hydrolase [Deltaproteobacteria bacterium]